MVHGLETLREINNRETKRLLGNKPPSRKITAPAEISNNPASLRAYLNRPWLDTTNPGEIRSLVNSGVLNDRPSNNGSTLEDATRGANTTNPGEIRRFVNRRL